ncbi:hypothetical protein E2562_036995 [Oryza meyeriana var. granulata]|uniref:Uncharacterized protein n=1 Tax=Oryza meyeriana var. granulata TaxID=110450 RepID=A0A6G1F201_9ORYZ|nr:hypothetical protein E2562_036995 [Oryza meyeriana var. granulata]
MWLVLQRGGSKGVMVLVHAADQWSLGGAGVLLSMRWGEACEEDGGVTGARSMGGLLVRVVLGGVRGTGCRWRQGG